MTISWGVPNAWAVGIEGGEMVKDRAGVPASAPDGIPDGLMVAVNEGVPNACWLAMLLGVTVKLRAGAPKAWAEGIPEGLIVPDMEGVPRAWAEGIAEGETLALAPAMLRAPIVAVEAIADGAMVPVRVGEPKAWADGIPVAITPVTISAASKLSATIIRVGDTRLTQVIPVKVPVVIEVSVVVARETPSTNKVRVDPSIDILTLALVTRVPLVVTNVVIAPATSLPIRQVPVVWWLSWLK